MFNCVGVIPHANILCIMSWLTNLIGSASQMAALYPGIGTGVSLGLQGLSSFAGKQSAIDQLENEQGFIANQAKINREFQREERIQTQEFNKEMWNLNNDYNSPIEQLKRAQMAGINPNSVIGGLNSTSAKPVQSTPMSGSPASSAGSIASNLLTYDPVAANLMMQNKLLETQANNNEYELTWNKMTEQERYESLQKSNDQITANINKITEDIGKIQFDKEIATAYYNWYSRLSEEDLKIKSEQLNLLRNQSLEILSNIRKNDATTKLIDQQTEGQDLDNQLKEIAVSFSSITGVPEGTPLHMTLFKLWKEGKFDDVNSVLSQYAVSESVRQDYSTRLGYMGKDLIEDTTDNAREVINNSVYGKTFGRLNRFILDNGLDDHTLKGLIQRRALRFFRIPYGW